MSDGLHGPAARGSFGERTAMLLGLAVVIGLGLALRWAHLVHTGFFYDGDEAYIALVGLHVAKGQEVPFIQHGAHYMGTADAFVTALLLRCFGISAEVHKWTHLLYSGLALVLLGWASWRLWGWGGAYGAVGLLAFAPSAIRWQVDANTNYAIMLALECGVMALTLAVLLEWRQGKAPSAPIVGWWALLSGLAFWQHSLIVALTLAFLCLAWLHRGLLTRATAPIAAVWFAVGASPLLIHNVTHSFSTLRTFAGFFLDISSRRQVEEGSVAQVVAGGVWKHLDPAGLGATLLSALRGPSFTPAGVLADAGPIALAVLALLVISASTACWREMRRHGWRGWLATQEGLVLGWLLLSLGLVVFLGSTRARYLSLSLPLLALLAGGRWTGALLGRATQAVLVVSLACYLAAVSAMLNVVRPEPTANPIPELAAFLENRGLHQGYAEYNLAYPLMLYTEERVTVSSLAGPVMMDRFRHHTQMVDGAASPFYIYETGEPLKNALLGYLRTNGIRFDEATVGRYAVVWNLSRSVKPDEFLPPAYLGTYRREHDVNVGT